MSRKVEKLYFELMSAIGNTGQPPLCADPEYIDLYFHESKYSKGGSRALDYSVIMKEQEAKLICNLCPFKAQCAEYAIVAEEEFGVWGGLSATERNQLRRGRAPKVVRTVITDDELPIYPPSLETE